MAWVEVDRVANRLAQRTGLDLAGEFVAINGGIFPCVRPVAPERPSGFSIVLSRSPRAVLASFEPDNYARPLVDQIQDTFGMASSGIEALLKDLVADNDRLVVAVDGERIGPNVELPVQAWASFSVECERRLPRVTNNGDELLETAVDAAGVVLAVVLAGLPVEDVCESANEAEGGLPEGALVRVPVNRYERSPANRAACIAHFGSSCQVCGLELGSRYGEIGRDFVHVHHRTPVAQIGAGYVINPVRDLVPLCPNCHAMVHRRNPPFTVDELRDLLVPLLPLG